jgi:hypothetical protein
MVKIQKYVPEIILLGLIGFNIYHAYTQENQHALIGWALAMVVEINFLYLRSNLKGGTNGRKE